MTLFGGGLLQVLSYLQGGVCASVAASKDTVFERSTLTGVAGTLNGIQAATDGNLYVSYFSGTLKKNELHRIGNPNGAATYDTTAFVFPITGASAGYPVYLPSFVSGFRYHNTTRSCAKTAVPQSGNANDQIRVTPNPADGFIMISGSLDSGTGQSSVTITDATGRRIATDEKLPARIDMRGQPAGIYFYRVCGANGCLKSGKILVTH